MWWIIGGLAAICVVVSLVCWAACAVATEADRQIAGWDDDGKPRNDVTGQPLTLRERYESECV